VQWQPYAPGVENVTRKSLPPSAAITAATPRARSRHRCSQTPNRCVVCDEGPLPRACTTLSVTSLSENKLVSVATDAFTRGVSFIVSFSLLLTIFHFRVTTPMPRTSRKCYVVS